MAAAKAPAEPAHPAAAAIDKPDAEMITLKPGIWGISVDLKEVARRLCRRFKRA
jgi:hypothetical protein